MVKFCPYCEEEYAEFYTECPIHNVPLKPAERGMVEWWLPYATPLPTWDEYIVRGYRIALTFLRKRPPSDLLKLESYKALVGTMTFTEGSVGLHWHSTRRAWVPHFRCSMREDEPMDLYARLLRERVWLIKRIERAVHVRGLKAVTELRIMRRWILGRRAKIADYLIQHGFTPSQSTAKDFIRRYGLRYKHRVMPIIATESPQEERLEVTRVIEYP